MARLKLFAVFREIAGTGEAVFDADTVNGLLTLAAEQFGPQFAGQMQSAAVAVNGVDSKSLNGMQTLIGPDDEVALLPPVSGGAARRAAAGEGVPGFLIGAAVFSLLLVGASWLSATALAAAVGVAAALSATGAPRASRGPGGLKAVTAAVCAAFPIAALVGGRPSLFWVSAAGLFSLGVGFMLRSPVPGVATAIAQEMWICLYFGFLSSYLVIFLQESADPRPLTALAAMVAVFAPARTLIATRFEPRATGRPDLLSPASLAAVAACEIVALASGPVLLDFLTPAATAILGVLVGVCILVGGDGAALMRGRQEGAGAGVRGGGIRNGAPVLGMLEPFLLSAPAMYHAVRFYLT